MKDRKDTLSVLIGLVLLISTAFNFEAKEKLPEPYLIFNTSGVIKCFSKKENSRQCYYTDCMILGYTMERELRQEIDRNTCPYPPIAFSAPSSAPLE